MIAHPHQVLLARLESVLEERDGRDDAHRTVHVWEYSNGWGAWITVTVGGKSVGTEEEVNRQRSGAAAVRALAVKVLAKREGIA